MPNLRCMYPSLRPRVKCLSGSMALAGNRRVSCRAKVQLTRFHSSGNGKRFRPHTTLLTSLSYGSGFVCVINSFLYFMRI